MNFKHSLAHLDLASLLAELLPVRSPCSTCAPGTSMASPKSVMFLFSERKNSWGIETIAYKRSDPAKLEVNRAEGTSILTREVIPRSCWPMFMENLHGKMMLKHQNLLPTPQSANFPHATAIDWGYIPSPTRHFSQSRTVLQKCVSTGWADVETMVGRIVKRIDVVSPKNMLGSVYSHMMVNISLLYG